MPVFVNPSRLQIPVYLVAWLLTFVGEIPLGMADEPSAEPRVVEQQTREFKISIDGTERGKLTMQLAKRDDGTETMRGQTALSFNFVVYNYRYSSSGTEVWKSGRLLQLKNESDYNGDKYIVQASAQKQELAIEVNGETQRTDADVWVTSYWREPEPHKVGQKLSLFEADKGRKRTGTLKRIGTEQLSVAEKKVKATRYQIRGDVEVDVWYDEEKRLMRQDTLESGHRALLELTQITR